MNEAIFARDVLSLRKSAMEAGLRPTVVEVGPDRWDTMLFCSRVFGLEIEPRSEPGIAVLAMPWKVGRYECVVPMRFEAA